MRRRAGTGDTHLGSDTKKFSLYFLTENNGEIVKCNPSTICKSHYFYEKKKNYDIIKQDFI